jgi:poly-gamma-glutamate capsule biosynthesis protein CapA/YwtB (metallophosphatase superfamily)
VSRRFFFALVVLVAGGLLGTGSFVVWSRAAGPTPTTTPVAVETTTTSSSTTSTSSTTTTTLPATTTTTLPPKGTLVIHGTGDVAVDPWYIPAFRREGWDHAWAGLHGIFLDDDLTVINLECTPSDLGEPLQKAFTFRCPTEALPSIRANGIEVANLANNHAGDFGKEALVDGLDQLRAVGIAPVGVGRNRDEAGQPAFFEIDGWKIAVVGFGGVVPSADWIAGDDRPGMRHGKDIEGMVEVIRAAKEAGADLVIVSIHWGRELDTQPRADDIANARAMIEAGANIIFGHHQHRLNPMERVDGAAVFWGLGNFVWPHNSVPSATTAVARVVVHPDGTLEPCMIPAYIRTHGKPEITEEPTCGPPLPGAGGAEEGE